MSIIQSCSVHIVCARSTASYIEGESPVCSGRSLGSPG